MGKNMGTDRNLQRKAVESIDFGRGFVSHTASARSVMPAEIRDRLEARQVEIGQFLLAPLHGVALGANLLGVLVSRLRAADLLGSSGSRTASKAAMAIFCKVRTMRLSSGQRLRAE